MNDFDEQYMKYICTVYSTKKRNELSRKKYHYKKFFLFEEKYNTIISVIINVVFISITVIIIVVKNSAYSLTYTLKNKRS